ncbi:MAG: response regulator [Chitinophagaceae bacterium]|nr:response regulator [Chitinophagaceae bacterium]
MRRNEKICIIDDDEIYIFLIKKSFEAMEIENEVISYLNGVDALDDLMQMKKNQEQLPALILLDINMPIMDGWEFLFEFRKIQAEIPNKVAIYIVSSSIANEDKEKSKTFPEIVSYLSKPIELETLASIVRNTP